MTDTSVVFNILAKDNASGVMGKIGGAAKGLIAAFAVGTAVEGLKDAVSAASDLNESVSKAQVVFGASDAAVEKFAAGSASALGISRQEALESTATFGNFFEAMGIGQPKAASMSTTMVRLASDLASFNNASPAQVLEDIRSGLAGQVEPLRKYGVDLSDATLKQEAMREGMVIQNGTLTAGQKAQAAYALIMAQTKTAQGDFSRTSGGLANQQRILAAQFEDVKAKVGTGLLPVMTKAAGLLVGFLGFVQKNSSWLTPLAIGIGVVVAAVWLWNAAQAVLDAELWGNPIGLIILAIVVLVTIIVLIATKTHWFQDIWHAVWGGIKFAAEAFAHWFMSDFVGFFVSAYDGIKDAATGAWHSLTGKWDALIGFVAGVPGRLASAGRGMWNFVKDSFRDAINYVIGKWNGLHFGIPGFDAFGYHVGGFTLHVPQIPYLATGGTVTSGGLAMVGEQGAEVVSLPTGASVYPHGTGPGGGGPSRMNMTGNVDGVFATALKTLIRTGQITFYDSTGQLLAVT